jgi:rubrerythrin
MNLENFLEVIDFAINEEQSAADFYKALQEMTSLDSSKKILHDLELMELGHKEILKNFKNEGIETYVTEKITNLQISDYLADVTLHDKMDLQEILTIAMKKEEKAKNLYYDLAQLSNDAATKNLFLKISDEEAKHKLQLESIYDDEIYREN